MFELSDATREAYDRRLFREGVPEGERADYRRWVRFFLDFCRKYGHEPRGEGSVGRFLEKLESKGQGAPKREQAAEAVRLLLLRKESKRGVNGGWLAAGEGGGTGSERVVAEERGGVRYGEPSGKSHCRDSDRAVGGRRSSPVRREDESSRRRGRVADARGPGGGAASWEAEFRDLAGAVGMRNYSAKTLEAYRGWVQRFQAFVGSRAPASLDTGDVKRFLTDLAVRRGVAGSTQNQAFNALLFFFRHVLGREFGALDGVVRAKRRPYVPVVLSRNEVEAVLDLLGPPHRLVVGLLYGCGLRLGECLGLRLHNLNLDSMLVTVHDGKGQKDRSVPLPKRLMPEIREQLREVRRLHAEDTAAGYAGTFLPGQLEKKFRRAARELRWQWLFPASTLTKVKATGERRRYHLHDTQVQAAVKRAAEDAAITKRVSPHTFRHTYASHLLMAGYDLQTIQRLLGHGNVKTTMIYVQTVPSVTMKEAKSPLDLRPGALGEGRS